MNGSVDSGGRALLTVRVRPDSKHPETEIEAWVDTGFTGDLVLPETTVDALSLHQSGSVDAVLADGSEVELTTYSCIIDWNGMHRRLEVVANEGDFPLLGVGLLIGLELRVNYHTLEMSLIDRRQS